MHSFLSFLLTTTSVKECITFVVKNS